MRSTNPARSVPSAKATSRDDVIAGQPACDEADPALLPAAEANRRLRAAIAPIAERETVALTAALGRVLAEDVAAPFDVPPHTNSAMDGYAVRGDDLPASGTRALEAIGTAWAGRPFPGVIATGQAVRIMTGAPMPEGSDTVVPQEHAERAGEQVLIDARNRRGQNVRAAGEDLAAGSMVLAAGRRLYPAELGLLASIGRARVSVARAPRVAFFSTGDELREAGEAVEGAGEGAIYDSNRLTLHGMLTRLGVEAVDLGIVPDRREALARTIVEAARQADVVLSSGGVSTGEADYVESLLEEHGEVRFWRLAIKPGRPLAFGQVGDALYFGLPGNPVAVMVTFYQFVQPALRRLAGERDAEPVPMVRARSASRLAKKPGRTEFVRGVLERDPTGEVVVRRSGSQGSGILRSMSEANCFIVLPDECAGVAPGDPVDVQPFFGLV